MASKGKGKGKGGKVEA